MHNFLEQLAQDLRQSDIPLQNWGIVFPSRRAIRFFQRSLAQSDQAVWAPQCYAVEDFILEVNALQLATNSQLLFWLYEAYRLELSHPESFERFYKWAPSVLADFNELDRFLSPVEDVYSYLSDVKRIESWTPDGGPSTILQQHLEFYAKLPAIYKSFRSLLLEKGEVYQGLAYRLAAEKAEDVLDHYHKKHQKLAFAGFNALNTAEEQLMDFLDDSGFADFYWDIDTYYAEDPEQEAGLFYRKSALLQKLRKEGRFRYAQDLIRSEPRQIDIHAVEGGHMQSRLANSLLGNLSDEEQAKTALVLADEESLLPFLNQLHPDIKGLNITMGLPLAQSPMASYFEAAWDILISGRSEGGLKKASVENLLLLQRSLGIGLEDEQATAAKALAAAPHYLDRSSVQQLKVQGAVAAFLEGALDLPLKPQYAIKALSTLAQETELEEGGTMAAELDRFQSLFFKLDELFTEYDFVQDAKLAHRFYQQLLRMEQTDLLGEPLKGLQLMGMLETRCLDFERVVLLSLNEGILPSGKSENSLIPFDIKLKFKLPTFVEKDAVYAYHFYRLLQRAKKLDLIYLKGGNGIGLMEPSRFILQLQHELPMSATNSSIQHKQYTGQFKLKLEPTSFNKDEAVMEALKVKAAKGFSPTALSNYLKYPMRFYEQYILGIVEEEENADVISNKDMGSCLHRYLETAYLPLLQSKQDLSREYIEEVAELDRLQQAMQREMVQLKISQIDKGQNMLKHALMVKMLRGFYQQEIRHLGSGFKLMGLEKNLSAQFPYKLPLVLKGQADRIDLQTQGLRIIDYKTGAMYPSDASVQNLEDLLLPTKAKALQLACYVYLQLRSDASLPVQAAIISLRKSAAWTHPLKIGKQEWFDQSFIPQFEEVLTKLFDELFDPNIPFTEEV